MKKAIVFVDANNWYHNVKKFFHPGDIDITKLATYLCNHENCSLIEIRWYASTPSIIDGESSYYKHMSFLQSLRKKGVIVVTRKLQRISNKELIKKKRDTLSNLDLCDHCKPIINSVFIDVSDTKKKEKGIDVWVAIDMIKKSIIDNECEICILISGDADFIPALDLIVQHNKEAVSAMVPWVIHLN